jgi:hypothetical protein
MVLILFLGQQQLMAVVVAVDILAVRMDMRVVLVAVRQSMVVLVARQIKEHLAVQLVLVLLVVILLQLIILVLAVVARVQLGRMGYKHNVRAVGREEQEGQILFPVLLLLTLLVALVQLQTLCQQERQIRVMVAVQEVLQPLVLLAVQA